MQQPELTDMQRAQAALVKVLPSPPPRSYILPAPSAASSAPSVVKIVMPPAAGSSSSQIRRLSISPTVQLSELMSTVITLCRLSEPFTLRYAPTAETATAIKTDEQLQAVFRQHQQQHSSTVIKLHVVHKSRRPLAPPAPRQPEPAPPSSSPTVSFPTAPPAPQPATAEPVSAACIQVPQFLQQDVQSLLRQGVLEPHDTLTLQQQRMLDDIAGFKQAWDRSLDPVLRQGRELVLSSQQPGTAVVYTYGAQREFHVVPPSFGRSLPGLPVAVSGVDAVTLLPPAAAPATAPPALQPSARFNVEVKQPKPRRERKDAPEAERSAASLQQLLSQQQELRSAVSSLRETTLAEAATMRGMLHGLFSKLESLELFIRDNESKREERREQRARDREAEKNSRDAEQQQRISQAGDDSAAASPAPYNTDDGDEQEGAEAARLLTPELDSASQQAGDGEEDEAAVEPFAGSASVPSAPSAAFSSPSVPSTPQSDSPFGSFASDEHQSFSSASSASSSPSPTAPAMQLAAPVDSRSPLLVSAAPLSPSSSSYFLLPSSPPSSSFPVSASAASSSSSGVLSSRYEALLSRLEAMGYGVRQLNRLIVDEHGGEKAELEAVLKDIKLYYAQ